MVRLTHARMDRRLRNDVLAAAMRRRHSLLLAGRSAGLPSFRGVCSRYDRRSIDAAAYYVQQFRGDAGLHRPEPRNIPDGNGDTLPNDVADMCVSNPVHSLYWTRIASDGLFSLPIALRDSHRQRSLPNAWSSHLGRRRCPSEAVA